MKNYRKNIIGLSLIFLSLIFIFFLVFKKTDVEDNLTTITVAAASDLRFCMDELKIEFMKQHNNIAVDVIYGSSGNLCQQLQNDAPFDIFFSADISYAKLLDSLQLTTYSPKLYAQGYLVLWGRNLESNNFIDILKDKNIRHVAIANPRHAPYGRRAVEFLEYYNLYSELKDKIIEGENISQAAQFVVSGNAEVGIIALSIARSQEMLAQGKYILLDTNSYSKLEQTFVIMKKSETKNGVNEFIKFIESPDAKLIFDKYFLP